MNGLTFMTGLSPLLRRALGLLTIVALLTACSGQIASEQPVAPISSAAVDSTIGAVPTELGPTADNERVQFNVSLRLPGAAELDAYLHDLVTPDSSSYQQYLAPEEFGARFGLSDARIAPIVAWLESG